MKNNFIILTDTRQQKEKHIIKEFDKQNILHIRTKLDSADYMAVRYDKEKGFYLDYSILIDTKKDIEEIAGNLCNSQSHERVKREIQRAKELGCKRFIFLVADQKITCVDEVENWTSKYSKVKGSTLQKILNTISQKYEVEFQFVKKSEMPSKIIALLTNK